MSELRVLDYMNTARPPIPDDLVEEGVMQVTFTLGRDQVIMDARMRDRSRVRVNHYEKRWARPGTRSRADELVHVLYGALRAKLGV